MNKKNNKILNTFLFIFLIICFVYFSIEIIELFKTSLFKSSLQKWLFILGVFFLVKLINDIKYYFLKYEINKRQWFISIILGLIGIILLFFSFN
jgi:uncharacterized membrane protein